jgi:lysine 6-dehydrogenase
MSHRYLIIGSGRQGTSCAYDLARHGDAASIVMADADLAVAKRAAFRINQLVGRTVASPLRVDAGDRASLREAMAGVQVALSAVTYYFNRVISEVCIEMGVSLCDMGGNTDVVWSQLELDKAARKAGVSLVPDCGMGPGLINHMGVFVMDLLDEAREVYLYDGGLPREPVAPWSYQCAFHLNGLTNEYAGEATFIREGRLTQVPTFTELELMDIPGLGTMEAFVISGSLSTTPQTHLGKLQRYETKVLRYPGHFQTFEAYKRLGLFSEEPIQVGGQTVVPRALYHALLAPHITAPRVEDICVMRAIGVGEKAGKPAKVIVDLVDCFDPVTGFTGMERLTGWHCALMMGFQARGTILPGAHRMEQAVPAHLVMAELDRRGIGHSIAWETPG